MEKLKQVNDWRVSEVELVYKSKVDVVNLPKISASEDAYKVFIEHWDDNKIDYLEQALAMYLDRGGRVLGIFNVASGGIDGVMIDCRLMFATGLLIKASSIIMAHNHPSGNLKPSEADIYFSKKIEECGRTLNITLIDNLIVTRNGFYSFSDQGLL